MKIIVEGNNKSKNHSESNVKLVLINNNQEGLKAALSPYGHEIDRSMY